MATPAFVRRVITVRSAASWSPGSDRDVGVTETDVDATWPASFGSFFTFAAARLPMSRRQFAKVGDASEFITIVAVWSLARTIVWLLTLMPACSKFDDLASAYFLALFESSVTAFPSRRHEAYFRRSVSESSDCLRGVSVHPVPRSDATTTPACAAVWSTALTTAPAVDGPANRGTTVAAATVRTARARAGAGDADAASVGHRRRPGVP